MSLAGLVTRTVDVDAWQKRMDEKREQAAHFRELDASVIAAASRPVKKPKRAKATGPRPYRVTDGAVQPCPSCGRATRPGHLTLDTCPGTVARVRGGKCATCTRNGAPPPQRDRFRPCVGCGRMTRPSNTTAAEHPGVVSRVTADRCAQCAPRPSVPRPAGTPLPRVDTDVLVDLYVTRGFTAAQVSQAVGLSSATILSRLRAAGAEIRSRGYRTPRRQEQP